MKRGNKLFLASIFLSIFLISSALALPIYVKPLDGSGNLQPSTAFNYTFNFTTNTDCSGVVLTNKSTITTGKDGVGFIDINISGLSSVPSYLCEYKDGVLRETHSLSDQIFRDVYARDVNVTGNMSLGQKITFAFAETIDNIVNGWIRITGNLQVDGDVNITGGLNLTGDLFVGGFNVTGDFIPYTGANQNVDLGANNFSVNTNTLFVDSDNGRVGIGTTTPIGALQVVPSSNGETIVFGDPSDTGTYTGGFYVQGTNDAGGGMVFYSRSAALADPKEITAFGKFSHYNTDNQALIMTGASTGFQILTGLATAGNSVYDATKVRMAITNNGNVGIGTTSPNAKLQVNGTMIIGNANITTDTNGDVHVW